MSAQDRSDKIDSPSPDALLSDLLALVRRGIELDLRVSAPAHVVTYNPATQRADVVLGHLPVKLQPIPGQGAEEIPQPPIPLPQVPVRWLGGSASYVTCPLLPGATGHVVFSDRSLSAWLLAGAPVDPLNGRTHALGDAVFEPGLRPAAMTIAPPTSQVATVVEGPLVWLGALATQPAVMGTAHVAAFQAALAAIATAFAAWSAAAGPPPFAGNLPPVSGAFIAAVGAACAGLAGALPGTLSTKVLVQ